MNNDRAASLLYAAVAPFKQHSRQASSAVDRPDPSANKKVDFVRFRDKVFSLLTTKAARTLDALVVWTQIRSLLKGSMKAALEGGVLSLATYLDTSKFSSDRCRMLPSSAERCTRCLCSTRRYTSCTAGGTTWTEPCRCCGQTCLSCSNKNRAVKYH